MLSERNAIGNGCCRAQQKSHYSPTVDSPLRRARADLVLAQITNCEYEGLLHLLPDDVREFASEIGLTTEEVYLAVDDLARSGDLLIQTGERGDRRWLLVATPAWLEEEDRRTPPKTPRRATRECSSAGRLRLQCPV